jgi:hypothetical protein
LKRGINVEGQNFVIEYRSADGRTERYPDLAAELVRLAALPGVRLLQHRADIGEWLNLTQSRGEGRQRL